ncbi:uncharacterized protein LOC107016772 [Solanum pennellii]|uniref:Uncharacterized protein LOC107016772 n=1 Tax=Solanum pennellii TaxID=28526 RepID=A0ABM1GL23_SOLPN|nr:uncharacterized protein LOC107016772 [Solanum pennellii]
MAGARPLLNFAFYFVVVLATTTVTMSRSPKMQSMGARDMSLDIVEIEQKLVPVGSIITCLKRCYKQSDCSDGWLCRDCANDAFDQGGKHCDKFTSSGQGYFAMLNRHQVNHGGLEFAV